MLSGVLKTINKGINKYIKNATKYTIKGKDYYEERLLAEGGFGYVYIVEDPDSGKKYALKKMNYQEQEQLVNIRKEIEMWRKVNNHSNIIRLFDFEIHDSFVLILMELATEGTLLEMINNRTETQIGENVALYIIREIAFGISHMHSQSPPIAHRDIKIENVLRVGNNYKLCDFGSTSVDTLDPRKESKSTVLENFSKFEKMTTFIYRPPEMCDPYSKFPICEKVDIWMLGCILYAILFKAHPFQDAQKLTIINAHYYIPENSYSEKIIDFMRLMLTPNPVNRPSAKDVLNLIADWKNLRAIDLPPDTKEIKNKQMRNVKSTTKTELTADEIYRVQQEIMKSQMKKNRFKRNDDDDDLDEIFDDLDVNGDGKNTKASPNKDKGKEKVDGFPAGKKTNNSNTLNSNVNGNVNGNKNTSNSSKPFEGFDNFNNTGNAFGKNNSTNNGDWMIDFNQGGFNGANSNYMNNSHKSSGNSNFENNFGFDFLDDNTNNKVGTTQTQSNNFADLDNVFSGPGNNNNNNNFNNNYNDLSSSDKSKSNNQVPNLSNFNSSGANNFNTTFGNMNNNFGNNNNFNNSSKGGFDFDKFNNSNNVNQSNSRGFNNMNSMNNNFNVTFGNNLGNSGNNSGNKAFNNDPFFGNAFPNSSTNYNAPNFNTSNNKFGSKSPVTSTSKTVVGNSNNYNNVTQNTAHTARTQSSSQGLGQKQGVNISQPKGEQNILDFFK